MHNFKSYSPVPHPAVINGEISKRDFLYQAVKMFISAVKLGISIWVVYGVGCFHNERSFINGLKSTTENAQTLLRRNHDLFAKFLLRYEFCKDVFL